MQCVIRVVHMVVVHFSKLTYGECHYKTKKKKE